MSAYWQKRFEILENARNNTAKQTIKSVTPAFDQAQAQIEKEINAWSVVFISHQPICNAYHSGITNAAAVISAVTSTATTNNLPIIGWFSGHVHRDRMYTQLLTGGNSSNPGTPTTDLGFTQVIITSDHTGIAYNNDDGTVSDTKHTPANYDKSHAIDFVTINKATRTVNLTRLGVGSDRSYTY